MPLHVRKKWPHSFGFEIYGNGPCYVILVEKGSTANKAGLMPGDQLLEVNGQDVTNMTTEQVRTLAKTRSNLPPELEVVSCLKTHVINPHHLLGYGFKISNKRPVTVVSVDYGGSAHQSELRVGDIILEANSHMTTGVNTLATVLSQQPGTLTLLTIPVARTSNMVQVDKTLSRVIEPDSRLFRAKDLHNRLENVMGNDYMRKMAVVKAIKQYAEDRDITVLCSALNHELTTKSQRHFLKHIRLLIPPAQRAQFDELINFERNIEKQPTSYSSSGILTRTTHHTGQRKLFQVLRESGSFGFVIKSCSPAFIESVDSGGAAEKAGLLPGDYLIKLNGIDIRKCDHDMLVQLLQDSGSFPTLEILRCEKAGSISTVKSSSSSSSHNSVDNILYSDVIMDKEGNTFTQKAQFLLTSKEWFALKKAVRNYNIRRDITVLYNSVSTILDNPSKKMLWPFLFVLLSSPHREYVSHHVNIPSEVLMDIVRTEGGHSSDDADGQQLNAGETDFTPSFKQQIDFLLTSGERFQFKKCLEEYKSNHKISTLKALEYILDTPSKKILWRPILPHLIGNHRQVMMKKLNLHDQKTASSLSLAAMDSYIGSIDDDNKEVQAEIDTSTEDDILYGGNQLQFNKSSESSSDESDYSDSPPANRKWMKSKSKSSNKDSFLVTEHEEMKNNEWDGIQNDLMVQTDESTTDDLTDEDIEYPDSHRYVTIIPVGYPGLKQDKLPFYNQLADSPQLSSLRQIKDPSRTHAEALKAQSSSVSLNVYQDSLLDSSSDDDSDKSMEIGYSFMDSKYSRQSNSVAPVLQQLDQAVLHEASNGDLTHKNMKFDKESGENETETVSKSVNSRQQIMQPPPPPPPLPLLSSLSLTGLGTQESADRMNVKRINWEKLDNKSVQNTVWEKLNYQNLSDVIRYLELETQFSTKSSLLNDSDKRKEVLIMDKKKAYNISILLGHLKMSVADMKQALYSMDEKTLSPDLLGQLLAFVPNEHEMLQYKLYKGDKSLLTKPDQFAYQMSLVEDYEERLKALRFKASFKDKLEDIIKGLESIKTASLELRNSKKLANLLEIILAMGNYMNKGNSRIGAAAGFRITFLTQLDITKTADKKSSFLNVLADAAYNKFPDTISVADELSTVEKAAKVSVHTLMQDIQELKKALQETSDLLERVSNQAKHSEPGDRFQEVMGHVIIEATDQIQDVYRLQASTVAEFSKSVSFFGEDPDTMNTNDVFSIFLEFIKNFEKAHRQNLIFKRQ